MDPGRVSRAREDVDSVSVMDGERRSSDRELTKAEDEPRRACRWGRTQRASTAQAAPLPARLAAGRKDCRSPDTQAASWGESTFAFCLAVTKKSFGVTRPFVSRTIASMVSQAGRTLSFRIRQRDEAVTPMRTANAGEEIFCSARYSSSFMPTYLHEMQLLVKHDFASHAVGIR